MELKELKKKNEKELQKLLIETREKVRDCRFRITNRQLKNVKEINNAKKLIARILTLINASPKQ